MVQLLPYPLLESLQQLLNIQSEPALLHYDTVFNVGDYYVSTLSFRHNLFVGSPIIPCGFLIHSRRYHSDHKDFMIATTEIVRSLLTKQVNVVTDREFKFHDVFPVGSHLFCWNHFESDLHWYLKSKANCTPEDVNTIMNGFKGLMNNDSELEFDREWEIFKTSIANTKVCRYFEVNIIPSFKAHAAIWCLKAAGIANPDNGVTNNASVYECSFTSIATMETGTAGCNHHLLLSSLCILSS